MKCMEIKPKHKHPIGVWVIGVQNQINGFILDVIKHKVSKTHKMSIFGQIFSLFLLEKPKHITFGRAAVKIKVDFELMHCIYRLRE